MPITLCHFDLSARDGWLTPTKHSGIKPVINELCTCCIRRSASSHYSENPPQPIPEHRSSEKFEFSQCLNYQS